MPLTPLSVCLTLLLATLAPFGAHAARTRSPRPAPAAQQGRAAAPPNPQDKLWNYDDAYLYWLQQRAYPRRGVNWSAYARAYAQRSRMSAVRFAGRRGFAAPPPPQWEFLGPKNLPVPYRKYYGEGTISGRVNGVAIDPNNSQVIYVASAGGGFWKSADGGRSWSCLSDRWENVKFSSVAIHPTDSRVVIVGTGDYPGALGYGYGLMMTTDGGTRWNNVLRDELMWHSVSQILFDPDDPRIITVTAGRHPQNRGVVYRSPDGGRTWSRVIAAAGSGIDWGNVQVGAKEADGRRYYYAVGVVSGNMYVPRSVRGGLERCGPAEIWRSADRGVRWTKLAGPPAGTCIEILDVATSPSSPRTVYVAINGYRNQRGSIWVSPDAGDTWNDTTNNFPHDSDPQEQDGYNWSQSGYDFYIKSSAHPTTGADVLYVGLIDIAASTDGGRSWRSVGRTYYSDAKTHNDQHALAVNPRDPNDLLIGNDGGVYRVRYDPQADSWTFQRDINAGLGMTMFYRIAVNPADPNQLLGGAQDNATPVSTGDLSRWVNMGGGDGGFCAINARDPRIQYATTQNLSIVRTTNGWATGEWITPQEAVIISGQQVYKEWGHDHVGFIAPIALDPSDPRRLYAGTNYLWRWDEDRQEWAARLGNQPLTTANGYINFIAVAPTDGMRIYTGSNLGDIWMTTDGGETWRRIDNFGLPGATPALPVTTIAVHPTDPDKILVGFGSTEAFAHLWACDDTRAAQPRWSPLGGVGATALPSIPLNAVVIDPRAPDTTYYVGTDVGVFLTNDGGRTWANFGLPHGLPNVHVSDLQLVPGRRHLVAATFGRGAWRIVLPEGAEPLYAKPGASRSNFGRGGRTRRP